MGSILLATPALKAIKSRYPACRIILLTFSGNVVFAQRLGLFDDILSIRTSSLLLFTLDTLRNLWIIRRMRIDYLLDLEFFARFSTIVAYLSGTSCRVGYYMPQIWRGHLLDIPVHFNPYRHVCDIFAAQVEAIGISVDDPAVVVPRIEPASLARVREVLGQAGIGDGVAIVAVNVNASELSLERRWPRENFVALMDALARHSGVRMVLIGSADERDYVEAVYNDLLPITRSNSLNLAGRQTLDEMIALLSICDACISNDSGPLHIAAALGIRTVSFFGPESPLLYGPRGAGHKVFYAGIYCSPCLSVYNAKRAMCGGNNICMQAITQEEVINALLQPAASLPDS
jgi:ADP-heptose:LPS heptosyltransferase